MPPEIRDGRKAVSDVRESGNRLALSREDAPALLAIVLLVATPTLLKGSEHSKKK